MLRAANTKLALRARVGLEVAVERLCRRVDGGNDHRLLLERGRGIEHPVAVRARAPNPLGLVVVFVAAAPVEEVLDAEPVIEQLDAAGEGREIARRRITR